MKKTENYSEDEKYMSVAIELAKKGYGYTAPNPVVGAVIVKDGCIIGQGTMKNMENLTRSGMRWLPAASLQKAPRSM